MNFIPKASFGWGEADVDFHDCQGRLCGTKCDFAAFAQEAAFVRFADVHFRLHSNCIPPVVTTLIQWDSLSIPPSVYKKIALQNVARRRAAALHTYAHKSYVAKHGRPASAAEYHNHAFVADNRPEPEMPFRKWLKDTVPAENVVVSCSNQIIERQMVLRGIAIGFHPQDEAAQEDLIEVLAPIHAWDRQFWLVTHAELHRTAKVQPFLKILKGRLPQ